MLESRLPVGGLIGATLQPAVFDRQLHPVQQAWVEVGVPQCGYCQSGQIMSATALLARRKNPTDAEIEAAMADNLCRCGTYLRIKQAIRLASSKIQQA